MRIRAALAAIACAACAASCGSDPRSDPVANGLRGQIKVVTGRAGYSFFQAAAEQFQTDNPDVTIRVKVGAGRGTTGTEAAARAFSDFVRENRDGIAAAAAVVKK